MAHKWRLWRLVLASALLNFAVLPVRSNMSTEDVNEQKQVRSCLSGLFECFPSDYADPSADSCSDSNNFTCVSNCPSKGESFFESLWSSKHDQLVQDCDTKFCYSKFDGCLGSVLHAAYSSGDWNTACSAWSQQMSCISSVNSSCNDQEIYLKYFNLFNYGCASDGTISYLSRFAACFPYTFLDLTHTSEKTELCRNVSSVSSCVNAIEQRSELSASAGIFFNDLVMKYVNGCSTAEVCKSVLSGCLGKYISKPLPPSYLQNLICSNIQELDNCVENTEYGCSYPDDVHVYLRDSCYGLVCEAGLESCYSQYETPLDYSSDSTTIINNFCSVTGNITACLDDYSEPCSASQNADASFRESITSLCDANAIAPGECYWSALKCFGQYFPTVTKPSALWSSNTDTMFCSNVDVIMSCLNDALGTCSSTTGRYPAAIQNIVDVIGFQCSSVCSYQKVSACQDSMTFYLTQLWTNSTASSTLCGTLSQQRSCYSTLTKQCSGSTKPSINVAVLNSIQIAIETSSCNFTTNPTVPPECSVSTAVGYFTTFFNETYQIPDLSADNYSVLCQKWTAAKTPLTSMVAICSGGVGDRINAVVSAVDVVISALCNGQCHLDEVAPFISHLDVQVQAALHFQRPTDYKGNPKKLFCKSKDIEDSEDEYCYDYEFFWGAICLEINSTKEHVIEGTDGCSDTVKNTQLESVKITADVFSDQCNTEDFTCDVGWGHGCLSNFSILSIYYPLMSKNDKRLACNLASNYTNCIWKSLVQCSPYFYLDVWTVHKAWFGAWQCTPPTIFDIVNPNDTLNITNYEKSCGADMIVIYIKKFVDSLVLHSQDCSGNSDDLKKQWKDSSMAISSVIKSVSSSGQCSVFVKEITKIIMIIDKEMTEVSENETDCHLDDAQACVKDLENFVNEKSLKIPPCGCPVPSTDETKSEFCSRAKKALNCIKESTFGCEDDAVADKYSSLYNIQNSTGINCLKPCDSDPCQHGSVCSDDADGKSYNCKCSIGFSGKNCENNDCDKKKIFDCFKLTAEGLFSGNFSEYCLRVEEAKTCVSELTKSCPSTWFDVADDTLKLISTGLKSHCDNTVPKPSPDCDGISVTCITNKYGKGSKVWDLDFGGFTDSVCNQWTSIQKCVITTDSQCSSNVSLSFESVFSFLCPSVPVSCERQKIVDHCDDLNYGHWLANVKRPKKIKKDCKSPDEDLNDVCPLRKKKNKGKKDKKHKRHGRHKKDRPKKPKYEPGKDKEKVDDDDFDYDDYEDDACWYLEQQLNRTTNAVGECPPSIKDKIQSFIKKLKTQYLSDGQCDNPCEENQCENLATCVPVRYGYECHCLPGYKGRFCEEPDANATVSCNNTISSDCLSSVKTVLQSVINGPYFAEDCSSLDMKFSCLSTSYLSCSDEACSANFQLIDFIYNHISQACKTQTVVKTCELNAAYSCISSLIDAVQMDSDTYCSILEANYECASSISEVCSDSSEATTDFTPQFVSKSYSSYSLICSSDECSVEAAKECLRPLYEKVAFNIGDRSICDIAAEAAECVSEPLMKCNPDIRAKVYKLYDSYMEGVSPQCNDACADQPCANGGTCVRTNKGDGFMCTCPDGFGGKRCDTLKTCDSFSIETCIETASSVFINIFNPCQESDCSIFTQLSGCLNDHSTSCKPTKKSLIASVSSAVSQFSLICSSKTVSCAEPPTCLTDNVTSVGSDYIYQALIKITSDIGPSFEDVCGSFNETQSVLQKLTGSASGCSSSYVTLINNIINWMKTISGKDCSTPTTCEAPQAQSCIDDYNSKVAEAKKRIYCPVAQRKEIEKLDKEKEKCVKDNTKKCTEDEKKPIEESLNNSTRDDEDIVPRPCKANPCIDNATCIPFEFGKFQCKCPPGLVGKKCDKEPDCKLNEATDCVNSFQQFVELKGLVGKKIGKKDADDFCKKAKKIFDCAVKATDRCSPALSSNVFTNLYSIQAAVGWSCFGYCNSKPCKNNGVCDEERSTASFPANVVLPKHGFTCKCGPGYSGKNCESPEFSVPSINKCFVDVLNAVIHGDSQGICSGSFVSTMASCISEKVSKCPKGRRDITAKISSIIQKAFDGTICPVGTGTCDFQKLTDTCFAELSHLSVPLWNELTQAADDNYCRKLNLVSSCTVTGCGSIVSSVKYAFGLLCDNSSTPIKDITDLLEIIEKIIYNNNKTTPKPPPEDTTPKDPTDNPRILYITTITEYIIYIDGEPQDDLPGAKDWSIVDEIIIPTTTQLIAVKGKTDLGNAAGIIVTVTDDFLVSDVTWKCINAETDGWTEIDFDDSGWAPAVPCQDKDLKKYHRDAKFSPKARFIWTNKRANTYDETVYCRAFFGNRQITVGGSCFFELYIDGNLQDITNNNETDTPCKASVDSGPRTIAVHSVCSNVSNLFGIILEISGGLLVTDGTWKCSYSFTEGWYLATFDISSWKSAVIVSPNDGVKFPLLAGIKKKTKFIWAAEVGALEVFCRAPPITIPPKTNISEIPPEPPISFDQTDDDFCWFLQKGIDKVNKKLEDIPDELQEVAHQTINDLIGNYSADVACAEPCKKNKCKKYSKCIQNRYGYDCNCLPGFSGRHCELGGDCNIPKAKTCIKDLEKFAEKILKGGNWRTSVCSKFLATYECIGVHLSSCSDTSDICFKQLNNFLDFVNSSCSTPDSSTNPPPPVPCETTALLKCGLTLVNKQYVAPTDDSCGTLKSTYDCVAAIEKSCGNVSSSTVDLRWDAWNVLEKQCKPPTCSVSDGKECIYSLLNSFNSSAPVDNSTCSHVGSTDQCLTSGTSGCDNFIKKRIEDKVSSALEVVNVTKKCVPVCENNHCQNNGVCQADATGSYDCECSNPYTGDYCEETNTCSTTEIHDLLEYSKDKILNVLIDSCNFQLSCSIKTSLTANLTKYSSSCDNTVKTRITAITSAINNVTCDPTPPSSCVTPEPSCQLQDLHERASAFFEVLIMEYSNRGGPDYHSVCQEFNFTQSYFSSLKCTQEPYRTDFDHTLSWFRSIVGSRCSAPICEPDTAQSCLVVLNATVNSLLDSSTKKVSPVMCKEDQDKFCGSVQSSVDCIKGNLAQCSNGMTDTTIKSMNDLISVVSGLCPLPCVNNPCIDAGVCVQKVGSQYECKCIGEVTEDQCKKAPSCDTNGAYTCIESLRSFLFWKGILKSNDAVLASLPSSFFTEFCSMVVQTKSCVDPYVTPCDTPTRERVYKTLFEIQSFVNTTCVTHCASSPCQNDGVCSDVNSTYSCKCPIGINGTNCEQDLCSIREISFGFWHLLKLAFSSFNDLCSTLSLSLDQTTNATANCTNGVKNITVTVQQDFNAAITPLCNPGSIGSSPDCNFASLNTQCLSNFQSLLVYFENPTDQQAVLLCNTWWEASGCIKSFQETNQCSAVISTLQEAFGYLCKQPPNNATNTTCDLNESVTGIEDLERSCFKAHEKRRPTKNLPPPPPSVGKCKKQEMPPVKREPPTEEEDICREVDESVTKVQNSVGACGESIKASVKETLDNLTNQYLNEGQCSDPCDPQPCANLGTCQKKGNFGYECKCRPSFTGHNCETGGACDESGAYSGCCSPLDQYHSGTSTWSDLCRNVDVVNNCLSEKLLGCTKSYDEVVFQLVIKYVESLSVTCSNENTTSESCEMNEVYKANQRLLSNVSVSLSMANPQPTVCSILSDYQTSIRNITVTCNGETTSLVETLISQSYGAQDIVCQNPNCSISTANKCIQELYKLTTGAQQDDICEATWVQKSCIEESTSQCDDFLKQQASEAVKDIIANSNYSCTSPCDTMPCRNDGTCQQTDFDAYECNCTANFTGKYCEIETGCNLKEVNTCFYDSTEIITNLLVDPCYNIPENCSEISSTSECVSNHTSECDSTITQRVSLVDTSVANISHLCTTVRSAPPNCDLPPEGCAVDKIHNCTYKFLDVVFKQYTANGGPDYGLICRTLNETKGCFKESSTTCTSNYIETLMSAEQWLSSLTGTICMQDVICEPESANSVLSYIQSEIIIYTARPGPVPDDDHSDFCFKMKDSLSSVKGNVHQCVNGTEPEVDDRLEIVQYNISLICPYPCNSNPCFNGGNCTETAWDKFQCDCAEGFSGETCNRVSLHPYKNHSKLNCLNQDRSVITQQVRLSVPFQIFCQKYSSLFVTENGYVSFNDGSLIINYAKFCQNKKTILAPLFAGQDCSCPDSAVYYQEYFVSGTDPEQGKRLDRASKDVQQCSSAKAPDFSANSVFIVTWENMMPYPCSIFKGVYGVTKGSTYQLVIASDMARTFAQFIYSEVNVKYQVPFVHSGFTDMQGRCINSVQSGTSAMDHFETVPSNSNGDNSWIYPLFDSCITSEPKPEDKCLSWVASATDLSDQTLDPCPCSGRHAAADPRYHFEYIDWFRYCYASNRVQVIQNGKKSHTSKIKQVCCYDPFSNGTLLTSPPYAGFPVVLDVDPAMGNDSQAHLWCCTQSNKYCGLFLSLRPIGFCNSYTAPVEALLWGDPHYVSLDRFNYTFNPIGEFVLVNTVDNSFHFQARTSQYTDASGKSYPAAVFSSLAVQQEGEVKMEVSMNTARNGLVLFVNGTEVSQNSVANYYGNVYVSWANSAINITYPSGWTMTTMLASRSLSFVHTVPSTYWNKTMGLLGNFNGDPTDDLKARDGRVLPTTATNMEIHYQFGLSWQISAGESLFTYPANKKPADYINTSFVPAFEAPCSTDSEKRAGLDLCGTNKFCYYDYCVTKDATLATNTKKAVIDYSNNLQILSSLAPMLTIVGQAPNSAGQYVVNATLNSLVTFTLRATSQQNLAINYYMVGNISRESTASLNVSSGVFRWTPISLSVVDLSFIAIDSNGGVSAKLQVVVSMCDGCSGNGLCDFASYSLLGNGTNYRLADCNCNAGWAGPRCGQDFDGCASQPCGPNNAGACTDMTPQQQQMNHVSYTCSSCAPGYHTSQCVDIDECNQGTARCQQKCVNTYGSYKCNCSWGYRLINDFTCADINECQEGTSSCPQVCTNNEGSFSCSCYSGFQGENCDPVVPCGTNNCDYKCHLVDNKPNCSCQAGYTLSFDGHTCTDVNECASDNTNFCKYKNLCSNTNGGYICGCPAGLQISPDRRTCTDCADGYWGLNCSNICNCNMRVKQCNKTNGCTICQSGWTGPECDMDLDECSLGSYTCPADSNCVNVPGTYNCACRNPSETNPDNTCGNNKIKFKLRLKLTWKSEYSDFANGETKLLKELLEMQLWKIFGKIQNFMNVFISQFFQSSVGVGFEVSFDTALTPARKADVGQTFIKYLIDNNWTIPVLSTPYELVAVPIADFGNISNVRAGDPCLNNMQCQNGGTCLSDGLSLPSCSCTAGYTGRYCETKITSGGNSPSEGSSSLTIGLAVGLSLGLLFIALAAVAIVYIWRRYRREKPYYDSSVMLAMDAPLHKYEQQPVRYHPRWPFSSGTGYDQTDT